MGLINLEIFPRSTTGKNANRRTRARGRVPAVIYGKDRDSANMELDAHAFSVIMSHIAGSGAIFRLKQDGVSDEAIGSIARELDIPRVTVESLVSFYAFLEPRGDVDALLEQFETELGVQP